ncbi:hypothetical protein KTQ42_09675|uniref:hypothetical protein n=1 Tax=Noviherbaspirillum sp. L7-7A TaxID=2850560 RepID=UPI001C2C137F|nr:hypothetical protein [Noviherbaspirillum sp. L7-7A]MBV0879569.1 hypothetical protein [Noviherbaspirillum sp. L7-7A]
MDAQASMPVFHLTSAHGAGLVSKAWRFIKSSPKDVLAITSGVLIGPSPVDKNLFFRRNAFSQEFGSVAEIK